MFNFFPHADARFVLTFLLGYRHFAPTIDLLTMLLSRYPFIHCHMSFVHDNANIAARLFLLDDMYMFLDWPYIPYDSPT